MSGITLSELLKKMIEMGGSDLHITTNSPPRVRVHGRLRPLEMPPLSAADTKSLAYSVLTDAQKHRFEENLELDFSFGLKNLARFRGNVWLDHSLNSSDDDWQKCMEVNFYSAVRFTRSVLPQMRKQGAGGRIIKY